MELYLVWCHDSACGVTTVVWVLLEGRGLSHVKRRFLELLPVVRYVAAPYIDLLIDTV
jgi:hypothetical protein